MPLIHVYKISIYFEIELSLHHRFVSQVSLVMISGYRHDADGIIALLGCYSA